MQYNLFTRAILYETAIYKYWRLLHFLKHPKFFQSMFFGSSKNRASTRLETLNIVLVLEKNHYGINERFNVAADQC